MKLKITKLLFCGSWLVLHACQDSPMVIYEPEPEAEEGGSQGGSGTPGDPTYQGQQPEGSIPFTPGNNGSGNSNTPTGPTSNGSGGPTGYQEITYGEGSYKIEAPADIGPARAYGLHIHLHGDGGGGYTSFPNRRTTNDLIGVAVRAPMRGTLQWGRTRGVEHANYLDGLIQNELLRKYNIRTDRIYFSGVSGGAYFLTGHFIPMFGQKYKSGALILCGGMAPQVGFQDQSALKDMRMHYIVTSGERGDITSSIEQSLNAYRPLYSQAGASTMLSNETVGSAGHCEFDNRAYTSGIQLVIDTKFNTIVKNSF